MSLFLIVLIYYIINCKKTSLNRRKLSYLDSPKWLKNKKTTINPNNNNNNCFQYALKAALNYENIKDSQRISKTKLFINQYNWKEIDFSSTQKDWKIFELNNKSIALSILFKPFNTKEIRP